MACDLGDGKLGDRQQICLAGSVLRLHGHSLQDRADEAGKTTRVRMLAQLPFFDPATKPRLEGGERLVAKSRHVASDHVVFDGASQDGGRDHAAFRPTGHRKLVCGNPKQLGNDIDNMPVPVQASAGRGPLLLPVALKRLAIKVRLRDEGRIEALRRDTHGCGEVGDRRPFITKPPEGFAGGGKRNIPVECPRPAAPTSWRF